MALRSFPVVYATDVEASAQFYERLGFERVFQMPPEGDAGYVTMRRGDSDLGVVDVAWPSDQFGIEMGTGPRFELFVYVDDVDATIAGFEDVLREAQDMPWGERVGYVRDPDGNPVALAAAVAT